MYIERDAEYDQLYINLGGQLEGAQVAETREVIPGVFLDLDAAGKVVGIEISGAGNVVGIPASNLTLSGELVGVKEAAELAGKDRGNFLRDTASRPDFPQPIARVASGQLWLSRDIRRFLRTHGAAAER